MLRKIATTAFNVLPPFLRNGIRSTVSRQFHGVIAKNWKKRGKPLPPPHEVKQAIIAKFQQKFGYETFFETGTFRGDMIEAQRKRFKKLISIELSIPLWESAIRRFKSYRHIKIVQGDSGKIIGEILKESTGDAIFWLYGHFSGGLTAMGTVECPILNEIDLIIANSSKEHKHLILIDDARMFIGSQGYPTIDQLTKHINRLDNRYELEIIDDIIICKIINTPINAQ